VQLEEAIDTSKPAYKFCQENNLLPVISSITQERLIRAGKQIVGKYKTGFKPKDTEIECEECGKKHKTKHKAIEPNPNFTLDTGFKVYETRPLIDGLSDTLDDDFTQIELLDLSNPLSCDDIQALLTTYKVHDGAKLNADFEDVILDKYTAYTVEDKIYFIDDGFTTSALKAFIEKIDTDKTFNPTKLVIFGYNFDSKHQREIKEAIHSYTNKKSLEIDMVVRY
jgi:adenine-specific DNA-methyltransferase